MLRLSKIFQPFEVIPKEIQTHKKKDSFSKSAKLMLELGIIRQTSPGCFSLLPMGMRALNKLVSLIDEEMHSIGGQKIEFPTLINQKLWSISGRINSVTELFKLEGRQGQKYILGPTHEEMACELLSECQNSYKNFPLLLYQITNKFRDELRPKLGLIRSRQFIMKDMYSFDLDHEAAIRTYDFVCESYNRIFTKLGVEFYRSRANNSTMGGIFSHEYHFRADIGDDTLFECIKCHEITNSELVKDDECPNCGNAGGMNQTNGIEVGHTFLLGDRYSKPFGCNYTDKNGKTMNLQMGCYGLGITRILASSIEILSTNQEIRWPKLIAPYSILIITPKDNSNQYEAGKPRIEELYEYLNHIPQYTGDVVVDDRSTMTIGRRIILAKRFGYPFIVILGKRIVESPAVYELHDVVNGEHIDVTLQELIDYVINKNNRN